MFFLVTFFFLSNSVIIIALVIITITTLFLSLSKIIIMSIDSTFLALPIDIVLLNKSDLNRQNFFNPPRCYGYKIEKAVLYIIFRC